MKIERIRKTGSLALASACVVALAAGCASTPTSEHHKLSNDEKASILLQAASGSLAERDPVGALQALQDAQKIASKKLLGPIEHLRALAYFAKKEPEEALAAARRAAQAEPDSPDIQNDLGRLLLDAGKPREAQSWLERAASNQLYRESYKANTNLGILYYRQGDVPHALARFKKATEQFPSESCVAYYYIGHLSLRTGKFDEAVKNYSRATRQLCASFSDAHLALGIAYERKGELDKARRKFIEVRDGFPNTQVAEQALERLKHLP